VPNEQRITPQGYKTLCKILQMDGCYFVNQEGSHLKYRKEQKEGRTITINVIVEKCHFDTV